MSTVPSKPIWQDSQMPEYPRVSAPRSVDVVVVGGGVTGLSTAYFLKRAGLTVAVVERNALGGGETGYTTAHLTCVTDLRLKDLIQKFGRDAAALTWHAGQSAVDAIERTATELQADCRLRRVPGFLHASLAGAEDEADELCAEARLADELGIDADFVASAPIVDRPAMRIRNQATFRPLEYLAALAGFVDGGGSAVYEHSEVNHLDDKPPAVVANGVRLGCSRVVVATHVPLMGKSGLLSATLLQSRLASYLSYVVSGHVPRRLPEVCLWDTSTPYYYLRVDAEPDGSRVIFGGNDHKTGQVEDTEACFRRLETTLRGVLPDVQLDRRWSGQVIDTDDGLPLIGETAPGQFVATGYNGNGITFATVAARIICDAILGRENPWAELFSVDRRKLRGSAWKYVKENVDYPYYMLADRLRRPNASTAADVAPGEGCVLRIDGQKVACSRDSRGRLHQVSAVCPHLGCLVRWNQAEQTWDCPCHGSRFNAVGEVLAGPAESPLASLTSNTPGPVGPPAAGIAPAGAPVASIVGEYRSSVRPFVSQEPVMKTSSWFSKMLGTSMTLENLECVLTMQLRDLASAEEQLIEALPKMAEAASSPELKSAFQTHLAETRQQRSRLDQAFELLGQEPEVEKCEAMEGLIAESEEVIGLEGDPDVKDAALIAAAQRVEHYEIAGYGCARTFARRLGHQAVASLLQESLDEEANADKILTHVAESGINIEAARS